MYFILKSECTFFLLNQVLIVTYNIEFLNNWMAAGDQPSRGLSLQKYAIDYLLLFSGIHI